MSLGNSGCVVRWLLFVEDPGAAVYVRFLPAALKSYGIDLEVLATGHAVAYFERCTPLENLDGGAISAKNIFKKFHPELLIVGTSENPETFAFALLNEARIQGIPSVGVVDSAANVADRFRGKSLMPLGHAPDWLIVPDMLTAASFEKIEFPIERIAIGGHPRFDEILAARNKWGVIERRCQRESLFGIRDDSAKVIVFISEISTGLNPEQFRRSGAYTLSGHRSSDGRTEIVLDEFIEVVRALTFRPYLVLRLHPKQQIDDLAAYVKYFDQISKVEPALEIVNASDLVVGMTSMLMLEAALMGRPVLSIVPKFDERSWLGPMGELIHCVWTKQQLKQIFPRMLSEDVEGIDEKLLPKVGSQKHVVDFLINHFL